MADKKTLERIGMTDSEHRKLFFEAQNERCALCSEHIVYGHQCVCDPVTKSLFCRRCLKTITAVRKIPKSVHEGLIHWANKVGKEKAP